jgi:hypothetical protein
MTLVARRHARTARPLARRNVRDALTIDDLSLPIAPSVLCFDLTGATASYCHAVRDVFALWMWLHTRTLFPLPIRLKRRR